MSNPLARGVHHIGLTVAKLEEGASFFISMPGWQEVLRDSEYPAIFASDGGVMVTLWKAKEEPSVSFDKNKNIGLHHLVLVVESKAGLSQLYKRLLSNNVEIEFAPELLRHGPAMHMMCYEPGGIRVEFIRPGN